MFDKKNEAGEPMRLSDDEMHDVVGGASLVVGAASPHERRERATDAGDGQIWDGDVNVLVWHGL